MGMMVYLFRRRRNRSRLNTKGNLLTSAEDATSESSSPQNSVEKLKVASRTTQGVPTWEDFLKDVERGTTDSMRVRCPAKDLYFL